MADAAAHIMGLLEEVIRVLGRTLEIQGWTVDDFRVRLKMVLHEFNTREHISPPYLAELKEEFQLFTPTIPVIDFECRFPIFCLQLLRDADILTKIPNIMDQLIPDLMDQLGGMESSLEDFLNHPILSRGTDHSSVTLPLQQQPCRESANHLLSLTKDFKEVLTSLHQVTKEAISLYHILGTSPRELRDSNNHGLQNHIKIVVVDHAGQQLEDFLTANFIFMEKIDVIGLEEFKHNICLLKEVYQGYEEQDIGFKVSQISSYPETGSLSDMFPQVKGAGTSSLTQGQIVTSLDGDMTCLDDNMTNIVDELIGPERKLSIVTIAGMGGIGKTTLAKKLFQHKKIFLHFHCRAWVNSVSNIDEALSHLLRSIPSHLLPPIASSSDKIHGQSIDDKGEILWKSLRKTRYLIVVDDLWNFEAWNAIERFFPDDNMGSRVLITSRFVNFPTNIPNNPPHRMRLLNEDQSWEMLKILVFGKDRWLSELVGIGKQIAGKCGGLPLAIAVVAGILLPSRNSIWAPQSLFSGVVDSLFSDVVDSLNSLVSDNLEGCLDILALSYKYLPSHLKPCFLFMGYFPANSEIDAQKLVHLWLAEGFLQSKSSDDSEKTAEGVLEELINRSLVSVERRSLDGKIKTCSIHDLLRQFCLREAKKRNFMRVLEDDATDPGLLRHLHLVFNSASISTLHLRSHPHLRSFILPTTDYKFSTDDLLSQLSHFRRLRVLDIYFLPLDSFPPAIKYMENLTYLALSITYVLDASISCLSKLETLVVYGPWIPEVGPELGNLPALYLDFWKMPCLRNVIARVPCCLCFGDRPPLLVYGSRSVSHIHTLTTIKLSSCTLAVFSLIPILRKLGVSETKENYENGEFARCFKNIALMTKLETLKCSFYRGNGESRNLAQGVLPFSLKKLTLCGSRFSWDKMKLLAWLHNLVTLKLKNFAFQGPKWVLIKMGVFGSLKQLLIDNTDLEQWEASDVTNHFPCLKRLVLRSCKSLMEIPYGAFEVLELIDVHNCNESLENSAKEFQEKFESFGVTNSGNRRRVVEKGGQSLTYRN